MTVAPARPRHSRLRPAALKPFLIALILAAPAHAQDIAGLEDCAKVKEADKKFGCLQSNVEFLQRHLRKSEATAAARLREHETRLKEQEGKLREHEAKLTAATARLDEMRREIDRLKAVIEQHDKAARK